MKQIWQKIKSPYYITDRTFHNSISQISYKASLFAFSRTREWKHKGQSAEWMEWNKAVHCVWCRITPHLYSWYSALAGSKHCTETSQTKRCCIPLGFKSSSGHKPSRGHFVKDWHRLSWEPTKHTEPELNFMHMGAPTPFQGHWGWLSCKLTHLTYRESWNG